MTVVVAGVGGVDADAVSAGLFLRVGAGILNVGGFVR